LAGRGFELQISRTHGTRVETVDTHFVSFLGAYSKEKLIGYEKVLEQRQVTFENAAAALLTAPVDYCHIIDKESPLYGEFVICILGQLLENFRFLKIKN